MTEDQLRLEFKLDLVISALQDRGFMLSAKDLPPMRGMSLDLCPVCGERTRVSLDLLAEGINRTCGCTPPVRIVSGISSLNDPPKEGSNAYSQFGRAEEVPSDPSPEGGGDS